MDCKNSPVAWELDRKGSMLANIGLSNGFFLATTPAVPNIPARTRGHTAPLAGHLSGEQAGGSERSTGQLIERRGQQGNAQHNRSTS